MGNFGSTSSGLPTGKKFIKKLLYVQHVDKEKDTASEIPDRYVEEYLKADITNFHDSNFTEYLKSPTANLSILKSSLNKRIVDIEVYSNPLPIPALNDVMIHAFVVFMTENDLNHKFTWWSLEKNGHHIVLQQSLEKDDVINKIYDTETKTSVERLGPVRLMKSTTGNFRPLEDLLQAICDTNQLKRRYHLLYSNCQHFASFVFEKSNKKGKKWSAPASAIFKSENKKIQLGIEAECRQDVYSDVKYKSIVNDEKFELYRAMMEGRRKDFEELINNLPIESLNSVDSQGYTLLEWGTAFSTFEWTIEEELKKKGAQIPSDEEGLFRRNVYFIALQYLPSNEENNLELMAQIDRIDVNGVNETGDTALHLALFGEKWEIADILCEDDEFDDVNKTNSLGETPLLLAAKLNCDIGLFNKIVKRTNPKNINKTDANGNTALHCAIFNKSKIAVDELLIDVRVDVNVKNNKNETALNYAVKWENIPFVLLKLIKDRSINQ